MIGLSFLGTGDYQSTHYKWNNQIVETPYFPYAFNQLFGLDIHYIMMTEQAEEKHGPALKALMEYQKISIPSGKTSDEIWDMFDAVVAHIPDKKSLFIDVTHGFRTQPMLALAAAVFLRGYKDITIGGIYYGAFEAKNEHNESPVFDLSSFLDLIDWTFAYRRYREKGDAHELEDILKKLHGKTYKSNADYKAQALSKMGNSLAGLMDSLSVIRPQEVIKYSEKFEHNYEQTIKDLEQMKETRPMALFMERLEQKFSIFFEAYDKDLMSDEGLDAQFLMLKHYLETSQYQQALTFTAELQISFACHKRGKNIFKREDRHTTAKRLNAINHDNKPADIEPWEQPIAELYQHTSEDRNDINHAGMRKNPKPAKSIIKNARKWVDETKKFIDKKR